MSRIPARCQMTWNEVLLYDPSGRQKAALVDGGACVRSPAVNQHQELSGAFTSLTLSRDLSPVARLLSLASRNVRFPCGTSRGSGLDLVIALPGGACHGRR